MFVNSIQSKKDVLPHAKSVNEKCSFTVVAFLSIHISTFGHQCTLTNRKTPACDEKAN